MSIPTQKKLPSFLFKLIELNFDFIHSFINFYWFTNWHKYFRSQNWIWTEIKMGVQQHNYENYFIFHIFVLTIVFLDEKFPFSVSPISTDAYIAKNLKTKFFRNFGNISAPSDAVCALACSDRDQNQQGKEWDQLYQIFTNDIRKVSLSSKLNFLLIVQY